MPQNFTNFFKPATPNYFGSTTTQQLDLEKLKNLIGKYRGIDFNTGKTVDLALEEYKKAAEQSSQPFNYFVEPKSDSTFISEIPSTTGAKDLSPTDLTVDQYKNLAKALEEDLFQSQVKQNVLGLGAATAFGAASLPFTEYMRNQELGRQMEAFRMREQSPTAQAARNLSAQQQAQLASSSYADKLRAFADLKRATVEPHRRA